MQTIPILCQKLLAQANVALSPAKASALQKPEVHEEGDVKAAPLAAQLGVDAAGCLVSSMFQALRLGGAAGSPIY